jgi:hypothetical protein
LQAEQKAENERKAAENYKNDPLYSERFGVLEV